MKEELRPAAKRREPNYDTPSTDNSVSTDISCLSLDNLGSLSDLDDIELFKIYESDSDSNSYELPKLEFETTELEKKAEQTPTYSPAHEQLISNLQACYQQSEVNEQGEAIIPVASDEDIQKMISYDQRIDEQSRILMTRFAKSLKEGNDKLTRQIMNTPNFDVTITDGHENTALHYTTRLNKPEFTNELIKRKANVNAQNALGNTPLHYSLSKGLKENTVILLKAGATRDIQNNQGKKPIDLMDKKFKQGIAIKGKFLQSASKGDIGALQKTIIESEKRAGQDGMDWKKWVDKDGNTALHQTVKNSQYAATKTLLDHGANISAKNKEGKQPAELAPEQYRWNFFALFSNYTQQSQAIQR